MNYLQDKITTGTPKFRTFDKYFVIAFDVTSDDISEYGNTRKYDIDEFPHQIFCMFSVVYKYGYNTGYL